MDSQSESSDVRILQQCRQLVKAELLILDDWGPERTTAPQRRDLIDIIDEPTFADAILDRLIHNARRLPIEGPSMCKTRDAPAARTIDEHTDT
jgi:DNA replication protein DnaC